MLSCVTPTTLPKPPQNPAKTLPKSIRNPSKIDLKRHLKQDTILDRSWRALGWILGGFWLQVGKQIGTKLAPKSEKWQSHNDVKGYKEPRGAKIDANKPKWSHLGAKTRWTTPVRRDSGRLYIALTSKVASYLAKGLNTACARRGPAVLCTLRGFRRPEHGLSGWGNFCGKLEPWSP